MITATLNGKDEVIRAVAHFTAMTGRSLTEEIIAMARLTAVELARQTQPWGNTKAAEETGKARVSSDINRVFRTPSSIYSEIRDQKESEASLFWKAYEDRDDSFMEEIMNRNSINLQVYAVPSPAIHRAARTKKGAVHKNYRAKQMVMYPESLQKYVKEKQQLVGFAKSGWAKAADMCGGHRGIPAWASSRHNKYGNGGAIIDRNHIRPSVVLQNSVNYVSDILVSYAIDKAIADAYYRTSKRIQMMIRANAKKARLAA